MLSTAQNVSGLTPSSPSDLGQDTETHIVTYTYSCFEMSQRFKKKNHMCNGSLFLKISILILHFYTFFATFYARYCYSATQCESLPHVNCTGIIY